MDYIVTQSVGQVPQATTGGTTTSSADAAAETARSIGNTVRYVAFLGLMGLGLYFWNERMKKRMANKRRAKARRRAARAGR